MARKTLMPTDETTTVSQLKEIGKQYIEERDWQQFHTPKDASIAVVAEAAELMELFQWSENNHASSVLDRKRQDVEDEAADVLTALLDFCVQADIDISSAFIRKIEKNKIKYPIDKVKGRVVKHTDL